FTSGGVSFASRINEIDSYAEMLSQQLHTLLQSGIKRHRKARIPKKPGPAQYFLKRRQQAVGRIRQLVLDPQGFLREGAPRHQSVLLEFAQLRGQHVLGDAADRSPQRAEPDSAVHQREQDLQLPLAAERTDGALEVGEQSRVGAAIAVGVANTSQVFHTG